MKRYTKILSALLSLVLLLCACGQTDDTTDPAANEPLLLTVRLGQPQTTLDPAAATAPGSDTVLYHLYENLLRWEDDGNGYAILAPGQAASYSVEFDYAGNATYTFTLRDDILWSNGDAVTSHHFAAAWKRLADPEFDLPHRELMNVIAGYDEVQQTGNSNLLSVSTPDAATLVVTLNGNPPRFLESVCAGAHTMPIRHNPPNPNNIITNGPYTVFEFSENGVTLAQNTNYYDAAKLTVETIRILPAVDSQSDYDALLAGEIDLAENLPLNVLEELRSTGSWLSEPVTSTLVLALNTLSAPLDSPEVRAALHLVIDEQVIVDALADGTTRAATGLVPDGVSDYCARAEEDTQTQAGENTLPDPNAPPKETIKAPAVRWDFRAHGNEIVTLDMDSDYAADCDLARELMKSAGYNGGKGFPTVDYVFLNTEENVIIAKALRAMWKEQLGINVMLRAMTQEDLDAMLIPAADEESSLAAAPFQIAALEFTARCNDAGSLLFRWHSASADNFTGYQSPAFDILIGAAEAAVSADAYDAYLHDAEAILLTDAPVIPLCYRGGSYLLKDGLEGLYRAPNGIYFFSRVTRSTGK